MENNPIQNQPEQVLSEETLQKLKDLDYNIEFVHKRNNDVDRINVLYFISNFKFE